MTAHTPARRSPAAGRDAATGGEMTLQHLDLCSGIGGFALAARMVGGYATRAFVEIDPFCRRVLAKNLPGVPAFEDIHDVTSQTLRRAGLWRTDLVTAGFPCQPWSAAGRRAGEADRRHLWPEVLRVVADTRQIGRAHV